MQIKILENCTLEVHTSEETSEKESYNQNQILDVDYIGEDEENISEEFPQFQFGNGDVVFINKNLWVKV